MSRHPYNFIFFTLITTFCLSDAFSEEHSPSKTALINETSQIHSAAQIESAIDRGVAFLLKDQNKNGSWGSPHNTKGLNIYGHYYASLCVEDLPAEKSTTPKNDLAHIILALQEKDGDWWDFPLYNYHRQYGTAFAIMTLSRCRP